MAPSTVRESLHLTVWGVAQDRVRGWEIVLANVNTVQRGGKRFAVPHVSRATDSDNPGTLAGTSVRTGRAAHRRLCDDGSLMRGELRVYKDDPTYPTVQVQAVPQGITVSCQRIEVKEG